MAPSRPGQSLIPGADFDSAASDGGTSLTDEGCPFCAIAATYQPYNPQAPPPSDSQRLSPTATAPAPAAFVVLSTAQLVAFLDILPLAPGHLLLCPRPHREKLSDTTADEARELGFYLRTLSKALVRATTVADWNVVQNNGAAAAQVVPHMHYHIIPRPELAAKGPERFTSTMFGRGQRQELDEGEAAQLAEKIRSAVAAVLHEENREAMTGGRAKF